ncbi:MltA domain-containing protein [Methylocella sp.]|uniref:MltA domain-containing protein n=1 Tax=Methylocella sp. TaxID=1978226 RepID=UPI003784B573
MGVMPMGVLPAGVTPPLSPPPRGAGAPPGLAAAFEPAAFADLENFGAGAAAAFSAFRRSAEAFRDGLAPLRQAKPPSPGLRAAMARALASPAERDGAAAADFFAQNFRPMRVAGGGFFTGYYEPLVAASLTPGADFPVPVLGPPEPCGAPLPDRAAILDGALDGRARPVVWLRDEIELFMAQVQGSAKARLPDGRRLRLVYAGRNGRPYRSIGRLLIERGEIAAADMSLDALKRWVRAAGQGRGERGAALMRENPSYVFFSARPCDDAGSGPVGGAGLPLTPLVSLAVDRTLYAYGTPAFVAARFPAASGGPLARLMIAQDVGAAIVGAGRGDVFFGCGGAAGARAGSARHGGDFFVLAPRGEERGFA